MTVSTRNSRATISNIFAQADARTRREAQKITKKFGDKTHKLARELCPVSDVPVRRGEHEHMPGFLRSRIRVRYSDNGLVYEVGWRAADFEEKGEPEYYIFTEFGTRFMAARPCVFPARDRVLPEYHRELRGLRRVWVRRSAA